MESHSPIVLYDGVCALCNFWVRFVLQRDPNGIFRFAALQSEVGRELLKRHGLDSGIDSLVLLEDGKAQVRSEAVFGILAHLESPLRKLLVLRFIPRPLRDALYRIVAALRYRLFGRHEVCPLAAPEHRSRFLG